MTGYDLQKEFQASVGNVWHAPDSQIYPELRRMEKDGLLAAEEVAWGKRGKKRRYHITDEGKSAFRQWMNDPLEYSRVRDPAHLKAAYLEWAEPEAAREHMRLHIRHHEAQLQQWNEKVQEIEKGTSPVLLRRLESIPAERHHRTVEFKKFTYLGLIRRAEQEIAWAEQGLDLLDEVYPLEP